MHDFFTVIWVVAIIIGVVSSISKGARRSMRRGQPGAFGTQAAPVPVVQPAQPAAPSLREQLARALNEMAEQQAPPPPPAPKQRPIVAPVTLVAEDLPATLPIFDAPQRRHTWRRIFANRESITAGIVAAQVFGPPLALRAPADRLF